VEREQISALLSTPENADTQLLDLNRLVRGQPNSELRSFSPSPLTPASSANPEVPGIIAPAIQVQTTRVALRGPYTELINLMGDIERLRTLFRVSNISLNPVQDTGELDAAFDLIAYIYNKDVPLGTAPAPEGQAPPEGEQAAPSQ
jgi:type IV pilus assembly protein PilO